MDTVSEFQESPVRPSPPATPPYHRLTKALQSDPRCGHEVALGRRVGLYRFCGDIGRGNFSKVKLAVHQLTRDKVAVKVVDRGGLDARALRMLSREIATLECVHHPNILRLFEVVETLGRVYLVTEWVRGGELYNHITQNGPLRETHASPLYKQLILAVKHMHSLGFVHRDIKAENVLLVSENRLKLADFGFSTELINGANQKLDTFCGSPPYAAPELFSDDHYIGAPVDVWALGVLLYFMVVGNMPFRAPTVPALRTAVLKGDYVLLGHISLPCIRLIQRILVHIPLGRPTIDEILASQWVTNPNLSTEIMQHEINLRTKPTKRSGFWFRTKSRRIRKTYSLRERYMEITNKPPLNLNTKKTEGIFVDNFLHPIEINYDASLAECSQTSLPRKSFFGSTIMKKKISPLDTTREKTIMNGNGSNKCCEHRRWNAEAAAESPLFKNYDEEKGVFIMLPTPTDDLSVLSPLEAEARKILNDLGVTSEMLRNATESGPRSDIIGAYRIVINRLQKQSWLAKRHVEIALQEQPKVLKQNRTCTIL